MNPDTSRTLQPLAPISYDDGHWSETPFGVIQPCEPFEEALAREGCDLASRTVYTNAEAGAVAEAYAISNTRPVAFVAVLRLPATARLRAPTAYLVEGERELIAFLWELRLKLQPPGEAALD